MDDDGQERIAQDPTEALRWPTIVSILLFSYCYQYLIFFFQEGPRMHAVLLIGLCAAVYVILYVERRSVFSVKLRSDVIGHHIGLGSHDKKNGVTRYLHIVWHTFQIATVNYSNITLNEQGCHSLSSSYFSYFVYCIWYYFQVNIWPIPFRKSPSFVYI